jgi:hypothetical protein
VSLCHEGNSRAALVSAAPDLWIGRIPRSVELDGLRRPLRNDSLTRALACKLTASNFHEAEVRSVPVLVSGKDENERWALAVALVLSDSGVSDGGLWLMAGAHIAFPPLVS